MYKYFLTNLNGTFIKNFKASSLEEAVLYMLDEDKPCILAEKISKYLTRYFINGRMSYVTKTHKYVIEAEQAKQAEPKLDIEYVLKEYMKKIVNDEYLYALFHLLLKYPNKIDLEHTLLSHYSNEPNNLSIFKGYVMYKILKNFIKK